VSLSVAIAIIVLADLAIIAALSYVMSRANLLTPHVSAITTRAFQPVEVIYASAPRSFERRDAKLEPLAA
jgi:hypothetical protein